MTRRLGTDPLGAERSTRTSIAIPASTGSIGSAGSAPAEADLADSVASRVAEQLRKQPWVIALTRSGWVAKALVYLALAWGAGVVAVRRPWLGEAEYDSIADMLAGRPVTRVLLGLIAIGLVLYIAFRVLSVALINSTDLNGWVHRVAYLLSAGSYATIAWGSAVAAVAGPQPDEPSAIESLSRSLLSSNPGRILVGLGGLIGLATTAYFGYKGWTRSFVKHVRLDGVGPRRRKAIVWTGTIGWIGRALIVGSASLFVTWAAIDADPNDARGFDSSLQRLADDPFGAPVVMAIALFLLVYAVYCLLTASKRQLSWSARHHAGD